MPLKENISRLIDASVISHLLDFLEPLDVGANQLLRVLTYHRVDDVDAHPELSPSLLSATPELFDQQMAFLRRWYNPVTIQDILANVQDGHPLPKKAVLVTFDDGYLDFRQQALPILKKYDIPAVLFIPTAYPDDPSRQFWWDILYYAIYSSTADTIQINQNTLPLSTEANRIAAYKAVRTYIKTLPHSQAMEKVEHLRLQLGVPLPTKPSVLSWGELQALNQEDVVILGAHTQTHPLLNRVTIEEAVEEAVLSYKDLRERIGEIDPIFAYPSGASNKVLAAQLKKNGFNLAFTTQRGLNILGKDNPLLLKRINMSLRVSVNAMRLQLLRSVGHIINFGQSMKREVQ